MALSVRLDPELETLVEQEARRLGVSKSDFVKDALERSLGRKNPADLLEKVRSGVATGDPDLSESVSDKLKTKVHEKHSR